MHRSARFWNRVAKRYAKRPITDEAAYEEKLRITRGYFRPDMEVLELGCGTGSTAIEHAPHVKHIRAIDVSSKMLEIAQVRAKEAGVTNVIFECANIAGYTAGDCTVDAVLALSVLHLLEDRQATIASVHRMLKPGGVFVSSTMCLGDSMKWFGLIAPVGSFLGLLPLVKIFTKKELEDSLVAAGFHIDCERQPTNGKAVFIVAKKSEQP